MRSSIIVRHNVPSPPPLDRGLLVRYSGVWQTASTLLPSGSLTNAA
jgi:hypothetical protein